MYLTDPNPKILAKKSEFSPSELDFFGKGSPLKTFMIVLVWTFFPFTIEIASAKALLVASSNDWPTPVTTTSLNFISAIVFEFMNKLKNKNTKIFLIFFS